MMMTHPVWHAGLPQSESAFGSTRHGVEKNPNPSTTDAADVKCSSSQACHRDRMWSQDHQKELSSPLRCGAAATVASPLARAKELLGPSGEASDPRPGGCGQPYWRPCLS